MYQRAAERIKLEIESSSFHHRVKNNNGATVFEDAMNVGMSFVHLAPPLFYRSR
jgi:hypothetical protein